MNVKKILPLVFLSVLFFCFAFAGPLVSKEAVKYYNEGVIAQKSGNMTAASSAYQKCLLLDPANSNLRKFILNNVGVMYSSQGDLVKAEETFKEALQIDPNYKAALLNLGLTYNLGGDKLKALEFLVKAFDLKFDSLLIEDQLKEY